MVSCTRSSARCASPPVRCMAYRCRAPPCSAYNALINASSAPRSPLAVAASGTSGRTWPWTGRFNGGGRFCLAAIAGSVLTVTDIPVLITQSNHIDAISYHLSSVLLEFTVIHRGETRHVWYPTDRFSAATEAPTVDDARRRRHSRPAQPPAKGGRTSTTAPSSSTIDCLSVRPTGSALTRKDDLARTSARRPSGFRLATTVLSRSLSVTASTDSSWTPAASFAAAQYLMVTLAISVILTSTGPWALLPPGPVCVYTDNDGVVPTPHDWRWHPVSELLLVTGVLEPSSEVLPALGLLLHSVRVLPADASALVEAPPADVILVDARRDLAHAKSICRLLHTTGLDCPMLAIVTEGGLAAISAEWNADDVILNTAGPAEVEARLRLATGRRASAPRP